MVITLLLGASSPRAVKQFAGLDELLAANAERENIAATLVHLSTRVLPAAEAEAVELERVSRTETNIEVLAGAWLRAETVLATIAGVKERIAETEQQLREMDAYIESLRGSVALTQEAPADDAGADDSDAAAGVEDFYVDSILELLQDGRAASNLTAAEPVVQVALNMIERLQADVVVSDESVAAICRRIGVVSPAGSREDCIEIIRRSFREVLRLQAWKSARRDNVGPRPMSV